MSRWAGFGVTFRQMFRPRLTTEYPHEKRPKPPRFHGRHILNRYEDGMEKCIGCELCAGVCPARCIYVRGADNPPDAPVSPGERYGFVYEINYLRCIHCDLCVEACPTEAITESKLFELSFVNRDDAIYTKNELMVDENGRARRQPWELWLSDDEDDNASEWVRATAPSGAAEYVGQVAWSGELGFGVRPPEVGQSEPTVEKEPTEHAQRAQRAEQEGSRPEGSGAGYPGPRGDPTVVRQRAEQEGSRPDVRTSVPEGGAGYPGAERGSHGDGDPTREVGGA